MAKLRFVGCRRLPLGRVVRNFRRRPVRPYDEPVLHLRDHAFARSYLGLFDRFACL